MSSSLSKVIAEELQYLWLKFKRWWKTNQCEWYGCKEDVVDRDLCSVHYGKKLRGASRAVKLERDRR